MHLGRRRPTHSARPAAAACALVASFASQAVFAAEAVALACDAVAKGLALEAALIAGETQEMTAATTPGISGSRDAGATHVVKPPVLVPGEAYALALAPLASIGFVVAPERAARGSAPTGGMALLRLPEGGRFRISLSTPHWLDVVQDGRIVKSSEFQGHLGCNPLHKVVEYELAPGDYVLQLSGADETQARVAITRAR